MIVRWSRKGLFAAGIAVAFVTPVAVTTTYINEVQHRPSVKQEVRHVTPSTVATTSIHRAYIRPGVQFEFRYVAPVESTEPEYDGPSGGVGALDLQRTGDDEIIAIILAIYDSGAV